MIQQQSEAISASAGTSNASRSLDDSSSDSENDNDFPHEDFGDEDEADNHAALQVSSVDSLFADDGLEGSRSSGALIMGKKSKPDRINLRSNSEQEADDRLDNEYGINPAKLSRGISGNFRLPIAKIKTLFDSSESDVHRYQHLGVPPPPSLDRNASTSSQNMVDLELGGRRHQAAGIPSVSWDLSKTAWSQHIEQSAFDASSRPPADWEAPSNETIYKKSRWEPSMFWRSKCHNQGFCWWFWHIFIFIVFVMLIFYFSESFSRS